MNAINSILKNAVQGAAHRQVPEILQDEISECGLACIAMVSTYHGKEKSIRQLRQRYSVARDGMSLFQIIKISEELGFTCRPLKLSLEQATELQSPCVLFWNKHHFVVLERTTSKGLHIVDPGVGRRFYTWEDARPLFSGVALEMSPGLDFTKERKVAGPQRLGIRSILGRNPWLLRYLLPMAALSIVVHLGAIAAPKLFSLTIDEVVVKNDGELLYLLLYIFGALFLFKSIAAYLRTWLNARIRVAVTHDLSTGVVAWLLRLPVRYFERRMPVDVLRRVQSMDSVYIQLTSGWMDIAIDLTFALVFMALIAFINAKLAAISLMLCTAFIIFRCVTLPLMERRHRESIEAETRRNMTLLSATNSVESMKLYGYESAKLAQWSNQQAEAESARATVDRIREMNSVVHTAFSHSHSLLICALGSVAVLKGENSIGDLFAFVLYKDMFMDCVLTAVERHMNLRLVKVELARVDDILDETPESAAGPAYRSGPEGSAEQVETLCIENGVFGYGSFERPTLDGIHFSAGGQKKVAIHGASGSGKSTLLKILSGFYSLDSGSFHVNRIMMGQFGLEAYRKRVAYVTSDDEIVSNTVAENVVMNSDEFDVDRLKSAIEQAGFMDSVLKLANGFGTLIGPGGAQLSSGEKQRLLMARALYRNPDVLFLDEPTSHLDKDSRDTIIATIASLPKTCIIATHDQALVDACDKVYRMEAGKLVGPAKAAGQGVLEA